MLSEWNIEDKMRQLSISNTLSNKFIYTNANLINDVSAYPLLYTNSIHFFSIEFHNKYLNWLGGIQIGIEKCIANWVRRLDFWNFIHILWVLFARELVFATVNTE